MAPFDEGTPKKKNFLVGTMGCAVKSSIEWCYSHVNLIDIYMSFFTFSYEKMIISQILLRSSQIVALILLIIFHPSLP